MLFFFFCRKLHWLKRQLQLKGNNSFYLSLSFTLTCILIFIDCDRIKINHFKCDLCTVYLQLFFFLFFFFRRWLFTFVITYVFIVSLNFFYFYYMILLNKKNLRKLKLVCLLCIIFMYRCIGSSPSPRGLGMTPWKKRRQRAYHKGINKKQTKTYERNFDTLSHTIWS